MSDLSCDRPRNGSGHQWASSTSDFRSKCSSAGVRELLWCMGPSLCLPLSLGIELWVKLWFLTSIWGAAVAVCLWSPHISPLPHLNSSFPSVFHQSFPHFPCGQETSYYHNYSKHPPLIAFDSISSTPIESVKGCIYNTSYMNHIIYKYMLSHVNRCIVFYSSE